jgi:hypothetical protein
MIHFPRRWRLYDFTDPDGESIVKKWARGKDKDIIARFNQKFDMLERQAAQGGLESPMPTLSEVRHAGTTRPEFTGRAFSGNEVQAY